MKLAYSASKDAYNDGAKLYLAANDGAPLKVALSTEPNKRPSVPREPFSREFHSYHFRGSSHS
jgi:hypothetical protein